MKNPVAKNNRNKAAVHPDKKKDDKAGMSKHTYNPAIVDEAKKALIKEVVDYKNQLWPDGKR